MIKAIATDLDGTLFYPRRKVRLISSRNKQFVRNAVEKGIDVILVTGRNIHIASKVEQAIGDLPVQLSIVGCNGAFIAHKGEKVKETCINNDDAVKLFNEMSEDKNIKTFMFFTNKKAMLVDISGMNFFETMIGVIGLNLQGAYFEPHRLGKKNALKVLNDPTTKIYKMMPWYGYRKDSKQKAIEATEKYTKLYGDKFEFYYSEAAVEIQAKGVNKANALEELLSMYGATNDEVLVVGDSGNDIPLFEKFENSFVMSHAHESVKEKAKVIIDSVADLEQYL